VSEACEIPAPFENLHGALWFACNYTHGTLPSTPLARMSGGNPEGRGLGGLNGAGQAGMILAEVDQLDPLRRNVIRARFTRRGVPCACKASCCSGERKNPEWVQAIERLTEDSLQALSGCAAHYKLRRAMVEKYFGARVILGDAALACGVNRDTASNHNGRVTGLLREAEKLGMYEIEGRLKRAGVID